MVFGTRPEAIKMAPLFHSLKENKNFDTLVCVTGQHRSMLDQVLSLFEITPDFDLNIMKSGQDLFDVTTAVLQGLKDVLSKTEPDLVLVHGDTTTAFATSIACFYKNIKVGHIEAGLRTYDLQKPFPEEFNRQGIRLLANWHFCPTDSSKTNLLRENVNPSHITVTGNTVIDALKWTLHKTQNNPIIFKTILENLNSQLSFNFENEKFILITGHRRENFGSGFINICNAISILAKKYPEIQFVYPVHLNPNVQEPVNRILNNLKNVWLIDPLEYEPFTYLLSKCYLILTDSGGVQEEAPSLGKPVLVMRELTERPEAIEAGTVQLVGSDTKTIVDGTSNLLDNAEIYQKMAKACNPYGDGTACQQIVKFLSTNLLSN